MIAIVIWTCLTVFFLGGCSKYYIVTSCICSCFVCYFNSRSAYFNVCDNWSVRCDCGYNEWICVRPVAEYFLTVCVTFPSVAVCVVGSLLYMVSSMLSGACATPEFLMYMDYFIRKDYSSFIANNFNAADHWSSWSFIFCFTVCFNSLRTCIVFRCAYSCYCISSIPVIFSCIFCRCNRNITV